MKIAASQLAVCVGLLFMSAAAAQVPSDKPGVDALVAGIPILAPSNDQLNSFEFTFETQIYLGVPCVTEIRWTRPDDYGMVVTTGSEQTPFIFLAQNRSILIDISSSTVIVDENCEPHFIVNATGTNLKFKIFGWGARPEVELDLASFLQEANKDGLVELDETGHWRLTCRSASGKSQIIATFERSNGFPIRRLEIRSTVDGSLLFAVRNIFINAGSHRVWPAFPAANAFPQGLKVLGRADIAPKHVTEVFDYQMFYGRAMASQVALRIPKMRNQAQFENVDWDAVANINAQLGPALRALLLPTRVAMLPPRSKIE